MFELIPVGLALAAACVANYTDLKKRIIPNKLTLPLIPIGIAFYVCWGAYQRDLMLVISGAFGAAFAFAIGYALWLSGGWAGGDVKLFTAFGALVPIFSPAYSSAPYSSDYPLFPLTILFNSIIVILPILLIYTIICRARGRGAFYEQVKITQLKEGMIPAEVIYEKNGKVGRWSSRLGLGKPEWDHVYSNPSRAAGLTRYQVGALKKLVRAGKLSDSIRIKKGMPFAPALGAGLLIAVVYGDIYWRTTAWLVTGTQYQIWVRWTWIRFALLLCPAMLAFAASSNVISIAVLPDSAIFPMLMIVSTLVIATVLFHPRSLRWLQK